MGKSNKAKNSSPVANVAAPEVEDNRGIAETLLGRRVMQHDLVRRFLAWPAERRDMLVTSLFAALVFIPWLGAVGMWDPWEVHYGEVARTMVLKEDYVFPYWENAYFFSKPPLTMWMHAIGMNVVGTLNQNGPLGVYTEWGMRMPFALLSILAVALLTLACGRVFSRRVGLIAGFALATSPLYFLLTRQAVTDTPFVTLMVCGLSCFLIAEFWRPERRISGTEAGATEAGATEAGATEAGATEAGATAPGGPNATAWWCWAYAFFALATLAKGLLGFMLPGLILVVYLVVTWDWKLLLRARIPYGLALLALIAVPWYLTLSLFDGVDDESKRFAYRFFVHDHFNRIGKGVHTTTPGGSFAYFIEQLGFAMFPWTAAIPGALVAIAKLSPRDPEPRNRAALFVTVWAAASFFVFAMSATKFHHYCFPVVPPLAVLCALYADKLWREGIEGNAVPILLGLGFFAAVAQNFWLEPKRIIDLYVYNYERPYPARETDPRQVFAALFIGGGLWLALAYIWRARAMLVGTFATIAMLFALYVSWFHWTKLSFHWTQRDIFWTYYQERGGPDEPIGAYYMNWRGETFYSSNHVRQFKDTGRFTEFIRQPGREWVIVEQNRFNGMKNIVEAQGKKAKIRERSSNKFFLVSIDG